MDRKQKIGENERIWYANHQGSDKMGDKKQNEMMLNRGVKENQKGLKTDSEASGIGPLQSTTKWDLAEMLNSSLA